MIKKKWSDRILKIFMFMAIFALFSGFSVQNTSATELGEPDINYGLIEDDQEIEVYRSPFNLMDIDDHAGASFPAKYDSRDYGLVTSVKNQGIYGNCWSFATLASMESSLIKQGKADASIDLSEYHLNYYSFFTGVDALGNTANDYVISQGSYMDVGGNYSFSLTALGNWKGFALERDFPLIQDRTAQKAIENSMSNKAYAGNEYYLKNAYVVPMTEINAVKSLVMDYGSAYSEMRFVNSAPYYNAETYAYNSYGSGTKNHAVTIVGWDDDFSASNFLNQPASNGAWIIKNSWGTSFGDNGYFYLSYEDSLLLTGNAAVFIGDVRNPKLNNYYYDGGVTQSRSININAIGQKITVKANPGGCEKLKSAGFFTNSAGVMYEVKVYINPTLENGMVDMSNPADFSESGMTTYAGYYMHDFENDIVLNDGDVCALFFEFHNTDAYGAPEPVSVRIDCSYSRSGVYNSVNNMERGENYYGECDYYTGDLEYIDAYDDSSTPRMNIITESAISSAVVKSASITAAGSIGLNLYAEIPEEYMDTGAYAVINGDTDNKIMLVSGHVDNDELPPLVDGRVSYDFRIPVPAKEMADKVTLQLFNAHGAVIPLENKGVYDNTYMYSVMDYIEGILNRSGSSEKSVNLAKALQNYNYAAREYFEYENGSIPEYVVKEYSADDFAACAKSIAGELPEGISYEGYSLLLKGTVTLRHYFKIAPEVDVSSIDFSLYDSDGKAGQKLATLTPGVIDGRYYVDITNIAPARMGDMYVLAVGDNYTLKSGPESYIYSAKLQGGSSLSKLMDALYEYSKAAGEYFAR